jgi:hypothetical protein
MDIQIQKAIKKDWGSVEIDKAHLPVEQEERKNEFEQRLRLLKQTTCNSDWDELRAMINTMNSSE